MTGKKKTSEDKDESNDSNYYDDNDKVYPRPFQYPHFQYYMFRLIGTKWIPFVEVLDIANSTKAVWDTKNSMIMHEGGDDLLCMRVIIDNNQDT